MTDQLNLPPDGVMSQRELVLPADCLSIREEGQRSFVEGLVVPYWTVTEVVERRPNGLIQFREQFAPGSFERAMRAPHRVTFVYGHSDSLAERLGSGESFRESEEGLIATFKLDRSKTEQARDVIETSHGSLSAGFISLFPQHWTEREGELVTRRSVHLGHVAAVPAGAYPDARVLAMRGDIDGEPTEAEKAEAERIDREKELLDWVEQAAEQQREIERPNV